MYRLTPILLCVLLVGCAHRRVDWTRTVTTHPDDTVVEQNHVIYDNVGFDTQAGVVTLGRDGHGNPTLHMENLKAEDMTARAALEIAKTAAAFAPGRVGSTP